MLNVMWVSKLLKAKNEEIAREFVNWALWRGNFNPLFFCLLQNLHQERYGEFALFLANNFCAEDSPFKVDVDKKLYFKKDEPLLKLWSEQSALYFEFPGGPEEFIKFWTKLQKLAKNDSKVLLPHEVFNKIELSLEKNIKELAAEYLEAQKNPKKAGKPGKAGQKSHKLAEKIEKKWMQAVSTISEFGIDVEFTTKKSATSCTCPDCVVHAS